MCFVLFDKLIKISIIFRLVATHSNSEIFPLFESNTGEKMSPIQFFIVVGDDDDGEDAKDDDKNRW